MTLEIKIREACFKDIPALAQNNQALAHETENIQLHNKILLAGVSNALKREDCNYIVAELNGEVIGQTMITYEWSDWRNGIMWWIQSVYVQSEHRKKGVFRSLFNHIKHLAQNHSDVKALRLYVMKNNTSAINTYKTIGMVNSGYIIYEKGDLN